LQKLTNFFCRLKYYSYLYRNQLKIEIMNHKTIAKLQKEYGFSEMQEMINSGTAWRMEGSVGREASSLLESGACMLPKEFRSDAYGNRVPSRDVLKQGTKGTYQNCVKFWQGVLDGEIEIDEFAEMD
jgi:hypothetical protein